MKKVKRKSLKQFDTSRSHTPGPGNGEWIGVEIECFMPYESVGVKSTEGYYAAQKSLGKMIKELKIPNVTVKTDGSIRPNSRNDQFETEITLLYRYKDPTPLKQLCNLLSSLDTQVNKSCGLHVHLDCRDLAVKKRKYTYPHGVPREVRRRGEKLENMLPLMLKMVSKSRRSNSYCSPNMSENRTAINLGSFYKHKTIEVRLHQGSINFEKISKWIDLLYRASRVKKDMDVSNPTQLKKYLGRAPKALTKYVEDRIKRLSKRTPKKKKQVVTPVTMAVDVDDTIANMETQIAAQALANQRNTV